MEARFSRGRDVFGFSAEGLGAVEIPASQGGGALEPDGPSPDGTRHAVPGVAGPKLRQTPFDLGDIAALQAFDRALERLLGLAGQGLGEAVQTILEIPPGGVGRARTLDVRLVADPVDPLPPPKELGRRPGLPSELLLELPGRPDVELQAEGREPRFCCRYVGKPDLVIGVDGDSQHEPYDGLVLPLIIPTVEEILAPGLDVALADFLTSLA
ncbi:MAG: hypothetical protein EON90_10655 [Brevundimonas sp.]|nr:MAG: hypothetical protein EON90_10655 [Brevundimonas sp.]